MGNKEVICVYQDCPMCGSKGKKLMDEVNKKGIVIKKVSFASPEGKELIAKAVFEKGIKKMPFFTDGVKFSTTLEGLEKKPAKKKRKTTKKVTQKGGENEIVG